MEKNFDSRFTHALLMAVIILILDRDQVSSNAILQALYPPFVILLCFAWALFWPRWFSWVVRKNSEGIN